MRRNDACRLERVVEDENGDLVVAIVKYTWLNCLVHSIYGFMCLVFLATAIVLLVTGCLICAIASGALCLVSWAAAWLNSNDSLKDRIYVELLEKHLLNKKMIADRFISSRFYADKNLISCITAAGEKKEYEVEFLQEKNPMYVVRIHIKGK